MTLVLPAEMAHNSHFCFVSDPAIVASVLQSALAYLRSIQLSADQLADAEILMAEVINNIIEHAYRLEKNQPIEMMLQRVGKKMQFTFYDFGQSMPGKNLPTEQSIHISENLENLPEGGFGWQIIRSLATDICYSRHSDKNSLILVLKFSDLA